jgi:glycosyltransferase involved in cell wall biosynthesis
VNVHQLLSGAGPHDAITTEAGLFRQRFRAWGWGGGDHAARVAPGLNGTITSLSAFVPPPDDVVLIHHSAGMPQLEELLALPNPKVLLYHNVTPSAWLWEWAPMVAVQCAIGREQLPALVRAAKVATADSAFNASELAALGAPNPEVIPLLVDRAPLGAPGPVPDAPPTVMFVGRLSPHKRQEEVIEVFGHYRRERAPQARLILVGDPLSVAYEERLRAVADEVAPGAVAIESALTPAELGDRYRSAHAFLCLSAHEGFCVPLLEAFHFGVPVVARPAGAVAETVGDAALLVEDTDPAVLAELLHLVVTDSALRATLTSRGRARLAAYEPELVATRLRSAVEAAATGH